MSGTPSIRYSIGQPLALDAPQRPLGTGFVLDAQPRPIVVPEVELSKVAVQVLLGAVLIGTPHAALEEWTQGLYYGGGAIRVGQRPRIR